MRKDSPIFLALRSPAVMAAITSASVTRSTAAASAGVITDGMLAGAAAAPPAADCVVPIPCKDWESTLPIPNPAPIPAVNPAYCHVGAGVAPAGGGRYYYVLQAAYTAGHSCGEYISPVGTLPPGGNVGNYGIIVPVQVVTPDAEGKLFHTVKTGQSLWAIAIAYKVTIKDIEIWNNISRTDKLQVGQVLFIPGADTVGYATPTPVGMIQKSTPDADGKIIHTVAAYNTLYTIADAYQVKVDTILALNNWLRSVR